LSLKRKRGRKKKEVCDPKPADVPENNVVESCVNLRRRRRLLKNGGRKPKGGKIILKPELNEPSQ
jgi:hypothetical protein